MLPMAEVVLKPGRDKSLVNRHPWVFSGAIERVKGRPGPGDIVEIISSRGAWLGRGAFSPESQIRVRVWTFDQGEKIDAGFFRKRLRSALEARLITGIPGRTDAFRVVNSEPDGLPGVIVDRYADFLVCQFLTAGAELYMHVVAEELNALLPCAGIYERSDADIRLKEGLAPVAGQLSGSAPPDFVEIIENGCRYLVDVRQGHKTGFYLDQRDNRLLLAGYARGREVLNCFSYTGGFGVSALKGGASSVVNADTSRSSLEIASRNLTLNGFDDAGFENVEADVFSLLRQYRGSGRQFDLIVLDPPKFVESKPQLPRASRGYKDINWLAFRLLRPGGILFTFSCSGLMDADLFQKIVSDAALDAGSEARIAHRLTQAPDHPASLNFPEAFYLKGLVCLG